MYNIKSHIDKLQEKHAKIVHDSEKQTTEYIELLEKAEIVLPKIQTAFDIVGFTIKDFTCVKTGINNDGDSLKINFKILPKSPTYRYIKFDGYDKKGAGKNHSKLVKRAKDLQDKIFQLTELKCQVNQYCFELYKNSTQGLILVDFWVKLEE